MRKSQRTVDNSLSCNLGFGGGAVGNIFLWDWIYRSVGSQGILL